MKIVHLKIKNDSYWRKLAVNGIAGYKRNGRRPQVFGK